LRQLIMHFKSQGTLACCACCCSALLHMYHTDTQHHMCTHLEALKLGLISQQLLAAGYCDTHDSEPACDANRTPMLYMANTEALKINRTTHTLPA
jgi:hypothetical protein